MTFFDQIFLDFSVMTLFNLIFWAIFNIFRFLFHCNFWPNMFFNFLCIFCLLGAMWCVDISTTLCESRIFKQNLKYVVRVKTAPHPCFILLDGKDSRHVRDIANMNACRYCVYRSSILSVCALMVRELHSHLEIKWWRQCALACSCVLWNDTGGLLMRTSIGVWNNPLQW